MDAFFVNPVRADIEWISVASLLRALGAEIREARGSRLLIRLNDVHMVFHRPHPRKELERGAVKSMRRFLEAAGVKP